MKQSLDDSSSSLDPELKVASTSAANADSLRTWLLDRDEPCPSCAYNLRGLNSDRCPECGNQLRLSVSLVEPYIKAWIALITAVLPPAGFGLFIIIGFCYLAAHGDLPRWRDMPRAQPGALFSISHVVLCVPISIAAIAGRRRFQQWPRPVQQICAGAAWVAVVITFAYLLSSMR
jgi:hypothetical protein